MPGSKTKTPGPTSKTSRSRAGGLARQASILFYDLISESLSLYYLGVGGRAREGRARGVEGAGDGILGGKLEVVKAVESRCRRQVCGDREGKLAGCGRGWGSREPGVRAWLGRGGEEVGSPKRSVQSTAGPP